MQSSSNKTPVTPLAGSNKFLQASNKSAGLKSKTSNVLGVSASLSNGAAPRDLKEIEEISKRISEHADVLYRSWKNQVNVPTEILDIYTAEAAAATGSGPDDVQSTEGLQKLVSSFVMKDKEQRGGAIKTPKSSTSVAGGSPKSPSLQKPDKNATINSNKASINLKASNSPSPSAGGGAALKSPLTPAFMLNSHKSVTEVDGPQKPAAAGTTKLLKSSKSSSLNSPKNASKSAIGSPAASQTSTKSMDLNFDINLDINLDVQALTLQQTENLLKIKELLKQEPKKASSLAVNNNSKIPSAIGMDKSGSGSSSLNSSSKTQLNSTANAREKSPSSGRVKVSRKSPAPEGTPSSPKKTSATPCPLVEENKQNEELRGQKKLAIDTPKEPMQMKKVGSKSKLKAEEQQPATPSPRSDTRTAHEAQVLINHADMDGKAKKCASDAAATPLAGAAAKKRSPALAAAVTASAPADSHSASVPSASPAAVNGTADIRARVSASSPDSASDSADSEAPITPKKSASKSSKSSAKGSKEKSSRTDSTGKSSAATSKSISVDIHVLSEPPSAPSAPSAPSGTMLTPSKLKSARPLTNGQDKNLRSPFLTRGSVAERVLMFEKCPDARTAFLDIRRPDMDAPPKSLLKAKLHATPPPPREQNSLQKEIRNTKSVYIPRFYFPHGKPQPTIGMERTLRGILGAFDRFPNNQVTRDELPQILKICGLPFYWRMPVLLFCQQGNSGLVERTRFVEFWKQMNVYCHDAASRFVYILSRGHRLHQYILPEDLASLVQDVVDTHPGLAFLKEATEFHSRYVHTVIARIFYNVNRSWSGRITIAELKKSDLLEIIALLEEEDDINQIMAFFSYEHFYVIYCKFWELDKDHDLLISQDDLARHSDHALSTRIVERIFSGCVTRSVNKKKSEDNPKMSYTDFVWFLLSEEDKRTPTAIEYWFRCMDIDGDGVLSMYELEYFYEEQQQRMESIGIESLPFEDCLCQMLDMIKPKRRDAISLSDLKRCKMTHVFFDTFFNLEKYLDHEQRDPFATQRDEYSSDWDRFAAHEYDLLITEEND